MALSLNGLKTNLILITPKHMLRGKDVITSIPRGIPTGEIGGLLQTCIKRDLAVTQNSEKTQRHSQMTKNETQGRTGTCVI
jgi:hypothetical protein